MCHFSIITQGSQKTDWPATPRRESSNANTNDTEIEECVSCFLGWLCLNQDCTRTLGDTSLMMPCCNQTMRNKAVTIIARVLNEDHDVLIEGWRWIAVLVHKMRGRIFGFDSQLCNILQTAWGHGTRNPDMEGGRSKPEFKEWEFFWLSIGFMVFLWGYVFPLGLWFSFEFMVFLWVYVSVNNMG